MKKKYRLEQDQKPVLGDTQKPEHVIIEGDNIYVLDYLSSPNEVTDGKETIDIIYIDPPYNTGNKFVYNDKWGSDEWKNFMRDRLVLAKPLLKNDGIIYISIGHQELVNLTSLCDEIFGRNNRITLMSRITKKGGHQGKHFAESCDYVLMYPKPLALMKHLIQITNKPEDITVLDFFAGSGSTGEAVISLNAEEDKKMRVILCAMNDSTDRVEEICSKITFERMKSVTQKAIDEAKDLGITISNGFPPSLVSYKLINQ